MARSGADSKNSFGLSAIVFGAWSVILLVAFLSYRGSDIGQLPSLFGNLGGGPLLGFEGLRDSVVGAVSALIIVLCWFCLGSLITSFVKTTRSENHSHLLELAIKTAAGAVAWSCVWLFLGLAGLYNHSSAVACLLIGFLLGTFAFKRMSEAGKESRVPEKFSGFDKSLIVLIAIPVLLAFIASLAPPTAKDTLLYHFALPKAFIAQGSNEFVEGNIASYLALGTEMHYVWAMLFGGIISERAGEAAAGATAFAFFPLLLLAIFGWLRELKVERRWALIGVLAVASVPTAYHVAASAYVDLSLALYVTLAIYSLGRWWRTQENGWLVFIAIFLGAALSVKLTTVFVLAAFALIVLLKTREAKSSSPDNVGKIFAGGFAALVLAGVIASPWYLRTWVETGSPIFPFYMSLWPGEAPGWDAERSNLFQAMNSQYGGAVKTPIDYILAPWNLSVTAQPELAVFFDGVLGVSLLFGLPILIWALWKFDLATEIKIGAGVAGIMFLFWLFSSQQLRYLLPILPVLAIGIVASAQTIAGKTKSLRMVWIGSLTASAITAMLVSTAWFLQKAPLRVVLGGESKDSYLARNIDYYLYYRVLNEETPADAKVWLINMRRDTYNLDRPYVSDYLFEDWTLRKMIWESRSAQELKAKTAAMNVQYVLARHDFLFDYDRSTIVDDRKPRAENEAKLKIAREFILDKSNTIRADEKFSLIKVF